MDKIDAVFYVVAALIAVVFVFIPLVLPYRVVKRCLYRKPIFGEGYNKSTFFGD